MYIEPTETAINKNDVNFVDVIYSYPVTYTFIGMQSLIDFIALKIPQ